MQEKIATKTILGELDHPADRLEICTEKVAICLAEQPKKSKDGKLYGVFDILDTPNGRILKTLCDYGCSIGVSSRANGETETDFDGNESVIPDSFDLQCWDAVLLPAVKEARMEYVTESLDNKKTLKQALCESLETSSEEDKKIMTETLKNLNIEYTPEKVIDKESEIAANDNGANMVKELQESLLKQQTQETQIAELQEKLSVCYAKEAKYEEDIVKYKNTIRSLSESASKVKILQNKITTLTEQLSQKDLEIKDEQDKNKNLLESKSIEIKKNSSLSESISARDSELKAANNKIHRLTERIEEVKKSFEDEKSRLNESIAETNKNLTIKTTEFNNKIANSNKLVEQYRRTAKIAVDKYIESQALKIGVNSNEIKNKLPKNYSFNDIDEICESLSKFSLAVSNLPLSFNKGTKMAVKESVEPLLGNNKDDIIDESLIRMANNSQQYK